MPGEDRPRQAGDRIESLLDALGAGGAVARGRAEELVRQVTDLYGSGLARILEILDDRGQLDRATLDALTADELVSSLLVIHGLHPQDLETRVTAALDSVRPYLGSHGGNVELLDVTTEGVVRLKLLGTCQGCPSSSVTLKFAVEEAIESAAPEVTAIEVVEEESHPASPAVIPVDALLVRLNHPDDGGTGAGAAAGAGAGQPGHWQEHAPVPGRPCRRSPAWNRGKWPASWWADTRSLPAGPGRTCMRTGTTALAAPDPWPAPRSSAPSRDRWAAACCAAPCAVRISTCAKPVPASKTGACTLIRCPS